MDSNRTFTPAVLSNFLNESGQPNVSSPTSGAVLGTTIDAHYSTELQCKMFTLVVYVIIFGTMCLGGLVGNSLSFVVLLWDKYSHLPSTFLLRALALTDNFFLLTTGTSQIFAAMCLYREVIDHPLTPYMRKYLWPLVHITQLETVWITVLISVNRFIAICLPFRALSLCTLSRVRLQVGALFVLTILYNIPRFYETQLKQNYLYNIVYENVLYGLVVFLVPFLILTVLNARLIHEIIRLGNRLGNSSATHQPMRDEEEERNITVVMTAVVVLFLVCQTPACINHLLFYVLGPEAYLCGHPYFYYYHISNLVVSSTACINFVVYCIFRHRFRQRIHLFFKYGRKRALIRRASTLKTYIRNSRNRLTEVT